MHTAKTLALAAALSLAAPMAANAGGWHGGYYGGGCGSGFWTGVGVVGGLIGIGILADALTRPDVVYVTPSPAYYPPPAYYAPPPTYYAPSADYAPSANTEALERDAYFAGYNAGREQAYDDGPYYPAPRATRTRATRR